jgi:membrane associated rhomboid family serine protease
VTEPGAPADGEVVDAPRCYRHGDRVTYVRCVRCDRPICPDCMREASVGFQCPECVREGAKTVRQPVTLAGGRVRTDGRVTQVLIALNVIVFFINLTSPSAGGTRDLLGGGLHKVQIDYAMIPLKIAVDHEYYRLLGAAFLHFGILHLMFNMYALVMFGSMVEERLGRWRYLAMYLLAAVGGSTTSYLFNISVISAGASGAIYGVFGATLILVWRLGGNTRNLLQLVGINLAIGFFLRFDNYAHVGGLVVGAVVTFALLSIPRGRQRVPLQVAVLVAVAALIATAAVLRTRNLEEKFQIRASAAATVSSGAPRR